MSERLIKAVVATAEVMGAELTESGAEMMCADLSEYPEPAVLAALAKCRRETRGRLTLADVIARIEDGRPGPEEAWAMIPRSESETVVWTDEMVQAWAAASPLLAIGDDVAARMAFKETYLRLIVKARATRKPVHWQMSLGHDTSGREPAIRRATEQGLISVDQAQTLLPHGEFTEQEPHTPALTHDNPVPIRALLKSMKP